MAFKKRQIDDHVTSYANRETTREYQGYYNLVYKMYIVDLV